MLFRKKTYEKIDDINAKVKVEPDSFLRFPEIGLRVAKKALEFPDGRPVVLNFADAQILAKKLSEYQGLDIRMPSTMEGYLMSQKLGIENHQYEWRSELIDGSFLMQNPEARPVNNPRRYDFCSDKTSLVDTSMYVRPKDNGELRWLGISRDKYDRAAIVSSSDSGKCLVCAVPPLTKDYLGIRLLMDENNKRYK